MELNIKVESNSAVQDAALLQKFILENGVNGIEKIEQERAPHQPGQQGLGLLLGTLVVKLLANEDVIKAVINVVKLISEFAQKFRKQVKLGDIEIPAGKLTSEQIERLALEYIKSKKD